jgi:hypothetical protein
MKLSKIGNGNYRLAAPIMGADQMRITFQLVERLAMG